VALSAPVKVDLVKSPEPMQSTPCALEAFVLQASARRADGQTGKFAMLSSEQKLWWGLELVAVGAPR
jgi:hypothetical protein